MHEFYEEAKPRIPSQQERILNLLVNAGEEGVLNTTLNEISYRYTDRIYRLKKLGHVITATNLGDGGVVRYELLAGQFQQIDNRTGFEVVADSIEKEFSGYITSENLKEILDSAGLNIIRKPNALNKK